MNMPIIKWLEVLPDGYRERALRAHSDRRIGAGRGREESSLSRAIDGGISWCSTKEGHEFWSNVHKHFAFRDGINDTYTPLPELPTTRIRKR